MESKENYPSPGYSGTEKDRPRPEGADTPREENERYGPGTRQMPDKEEQRGDREKRAPIDESNPGEPGSPRRENPDVPQKEYDRQTEAPPSGDPDHFPHRRRQDIEPVQKPYPVGEDPNQASNPGNTDNPEQRRQTQK